jgi:two-component system, NtrC family, sensor kinase
MNSETVDMMERMETANSFSNKDSLDYQARKVNTESANQALVYRPRLSFGLLIKLGSFSVFLLFLLAAAGMMVSTGRILWISVALLIALFLMSGYYCYFLGKRLTRRIDRIIECIHRIAKGDFSPIFPDGKYRDEFTDVDIAVNAMLDDLNTYHTAMEESHQLTAIGTLTAGVAHEINNPLNNIMLTAHTLLEDYNDFSQEEQVDMFNDLIHETERAQGIVRNLQDFARESECVSEPLNLGDLIEETVKLTANQAKVLGAKLEADIQPHIPSIHGDRQQWKQVFLNLILNALDEVDKGGRIKISVEKTYPPGFLAVHVEDNGGGIPAHVLPYIFDPFFTTKSPGKGTGLGLSVSKGIVTRHGGRIDVSSQKGVYTRFTVIIPATDVASNECMISSNS